MDSRDDFEVLGPRQAGNGVTMLADVSRTLILLAQAQRAVAEALEALARHPTEKEASATPEGRQARPASPRLLSVQEAAERIGMSASHVYYATETGRLARVKIGNSVRIREEDLERYIAERHTEARVSGIVLATRKQRPRRDKSQ